MLILITGISGFVGSNIAKFLVDRGFRVRGSVRNPSNVTNYSFLFLKWNLGDDCENFWIVKGDLNDEKDWYEATKGCTHVIHCASPNAENTKSSEEIIYGTRNVLRAANANGVKRFINTSTYEACYQDIETAHIFNEDLWADQFGKDIYTEGKIVAEQELWEFNENNQKEDQDGKAMEIVSIIPTTVVGEYMSNNF